MEDLKISFKPVDPTGQGRGLNRSVNTGSSQETGPQVSVVRYGRCVRAGNRCGSPSGSRGVILPQTRLVLTALEPWGAGCFFLPGSTVTSPDTRWGSLLALQATQSGQRQQSKLAYLVTVCSATEPDLRQAGSAPPAQVTVVGGGQTVRGAEVEEEGQEGRVACQGVPPPPGRGPHTGSPKRCFFFFAGFRGVSLRRSSSPSDSSISSSAEIRISDSDSSWEAALR